MSFYSYDLKWRYMKKKLLRFLYYKYSIYRFNLNQYPSRNNHLAELTNQAEFPKETEKVFVFVIFLTVLTMTELVG